MVAIDRHETDGALISVGDTDFKAPERPRSRGSRTRAAAPQSGLFLNARQRTDIISVAGDRWGPQELSICHRADL
jgi:hypothetical protein